ncbi:MAG: TonB-dependent receptor domain-containing protein [Pyrinomonadaceae bacterium]
MFASLTQWFSPIRIITFLIVTVGFALLGSSVVFAQSQSNAADLRGFVRDPTGAVVTNATVTARNAATNTTKDATTNDEGYYQIINLTPGNYEVTVEAPNFKKAVLPSITVTVGQSADVDVALEVGQVSEVVTISNATAELVETSKTTVATTIDQQRIDNLPINERNYLSFALTTSTVSRDNGRPIGPAPTTGLNFGGQRGRSNLVQVDGADNTDNSVNAARSTVSQEAVQEFQVVTNSFAPEFGRSSGGVVNVVTKSGTNEIRGNVFGFLRDKSFQARNPFAPIAKPDFRRTQYGVTLGGPFDRDRTFFFFAFEQRRRDESGFFTSNVAQGLTASVTLPPLAPGFPAQTVRNLRPDQAAYINTLLASGNAALINAGVSYAYLAGSGSATALTGSNPLLNTGSVPGVAIGAPVGGRFFLTGAPVPISSIAFRPLNDLLRVFPVTDRTTYNSFRLDHAVTKDHLFNFRFGYNPSEISGIQVESQNQSLGQNDFSRTGIQKLRDFSAVSSLTSTLSSTMVNELRFNFGERRATFKSQTGDAVAFNISDTAFIGRELFSPVVRTETRYEWTDNLNIVAGNHTLKFGGDAAFVRIPDATFELNFAGLFNFGGVSATTFAAFPVIGGVPAPDFSPVQQYGLGFPGSFIQGYGNPVSRIGNKPLAFFAQDSWKIRPNLTLNYGVRYDYEMTEQIPTVPFRDPLSGITLSAADLLAAQGVLNVQQGFPRDKNNWAPRLAVAWDPHNDGKTVIRAAFGMFYDHPLLAVGFNSDIADAAQQQQSTLLQGSPAPTSLLNAVQVFQGTVCTAASVNPLCAPGFTTPGTAASSQYQFGRQRFNDQTFPGFGTLLPFTLPVTKDFQYAYANQGNLTVERQITKNMSLSASYLFVGAHHLPLPRDVNEVRQDLLIANFRRYAGAAANPASFTAAALATPGLFPTTAPGSTFSNPITGETFAVIIPGFIVRGPRGDVILPFAANFFRPSGANYFLVQANTGLTPAAFNSFLGGTLRTPTSIVSPFGDVNAQSSIGNSTYHGLNLDLKKRFSNNLQFLASYTWARSIDDSSDLQTLLKPQNNRDIHSERADSLFDQRHRFVFSGLLTSPAAWRHSDSGARRFLADFTLAPIFEISSGRPFNILSGVDQNFDLQASNERPSVAADGTLIVPAPNTNGTLGRNMGITHSYASFDMRLMRSIPFGERRRLDIIAEGFNLFNRFNEAAAAPFFTAVNNFGQRAGNGRYYSRPTASFDPRQFQFGLKLNF